MGRGTFLGTDVVSQMAKHIALLLLRNVSGLKELKQAHALITKTGLTHHPSLLNKMVVRAALTPWGSLEYARSVFENTPVLHNPILYNTMIRAYSRSIFPFEAVHLYNEMCLNSVQSDHLTYPFVLKACGRVCAIEERQGHELLLAKKGAEIHCRTHRSGWDRDTFIQNSLMFMYAQCGRLDDARQVFDQMAERTVVSWNTMIVAYNRCNDFGSADSLLGWMPEKNVVSWNTVITRHVRLGNLETARRVFEDMPERDAVSWNSMIAGYIHVRDYDRALELFDQMQNQKVKPTERTIVSVLGACAETEELETGRQIHSYLKQNGSKIEGFVGNALLDMYAKCGNLKLAREVFDEMGTKHVSFWNSMIVALAVHGRCEEALQLFASLEKESNGSAKPNRVTFLNVLIACSHNGLVKEGRSFFRRMVEEYKIEPDIKHYGCMVDLLSRGGMLEEAYGIIKAMPSDANPAVLWRTLLGACQGHGNVELAEEAFREIGRMVAPGDGDFVLLSNVYAQAERWEDVERLRCGMIEWGVSKQPGRSLIV